MVTILMIKRGSIMIRTIILISFFYCITIKAMDENTPLRSVSSITLISRENKQSFDVMINNAEKVKQLKQAIAGKYKVSADQIIIRALPRHTGSVASHELPDQALIVCLISQYSNRFLWNIKS